MEPSNTETDRSISGVFEKDFQSQSSEVAIGPQYTFFLRHFQWAIGYDVRNGRFREWTTISP